MPPVLLVNMPFVGLARPSLGLSTLKSCLTRASIESRVEYAQLRFAAAIGLVNYQRIDSYPVTALVGEWAFSHLVFPDFRPDSDAYFQNVPKGSRMACTPQEFQALCQQVRQTARVFVQDLAQQYLDEGVRVLACTSTFQQNMASLALIQQIKRLAPEVVTVMGGANCEAPMGGALLDRFPDLDYVVSGEADELIGEFFGSLLEGPVRLPNGVLSRDPGCVRSARATVRNLHQLPIPDFDEYFSTLDELGLRDQLQVSLPVETSRGCWWGQKHHCTFCGLNGHGMNFRAKTAEQALEQFEQLSSAHQCRDFMVADNIIEVGYFRSVLPSLAERQPLLNIFYETKANLKREQVKACAQAGVSWIQPGLESLSDELLQKMDKGTTGLQNIQTLKWCRELGVHVTWLLLFAFPGDRLEWYRDMAELIPHLHHLQPPGGLIKVGYHRFSPYFEKADHYGIEPVPEPAYSQVYPFSQKDVAELAYFFVDRAGSQKVEEIIEILGAAYQVWFHRFWEQNALLALDDDGATARVIDTRHGGTSRRSLYQGLSREILMRCDHVRGRSALERELTQAGLLETSEQFQAALAPLLENKIVLERNHQLLSLAVPGAIPTLPRGLPLGQLKPQPVLV